MCPIAIKRWLGRAGEENFQAVPEQSSPDPGYHKVREEATAVMWSHTGFILEDRVVSLFGCDSYSRGITWGQASLAKPQIPCMVTAAPGRARTVVLFCSRQAATRATGVGQGQPRRTAGLDPELLMWSGHI